MINQSCITIRAQAKPPKKNVWHAQQIFDTRRRLVARADELKHGTKIKIVGARMTRAWHKLNSRAQTRYSF